MKWPTNIPWNQGQIQPIGLDIGHDSIKMLQLEVRNQELFVHCAVRQSLDPNYSPEPANAQDLISPIAAQAIRELLRGGDFRGRNVVACLPRRIVQIKNLRLPIMPISELESVVQFEARSLFSFEPENGHIDFLPAGEVRQGSEVRQEVIALGAAWSDVDRFVEQLHDTGALIDSLDVEPAALYRGIARFVRRREDEQEVHVLIDLGMNSSHVLIGRGKEVSFFKTIEIGGARFNDAVSQKLGITPTEARALRRRIGAGQTDENSHDPVRQAVFDATRSIVEDLTKEISLCLRYYSVTFRGQKPARIRLVGGEAYDPQLLFILSAILNVPIQQGRPLFSVNCDAMKGFDKNGPSAEWALALGLGLKRTTGVFAPLDGTPRARRLSSAAEIVDLNAAISPAAAGKDSTAQGEHFAAVRRAAASEVTHA